jgi:hypothetical protein
VVTELFPPHRPAILAPIYDDDDDCLGSVALYRCERCKAWTDDRAGHTAWHRSVDTDQTVRLPPMATLTGYARVYSGDASDPDGVTMVPTDTQGARHDDRTRRSIPDPPAQADREGTRREGG